MAYTPELSQEYSRVLRRIAWALSLPMTTALEEVIFQYSRDTEKELVCDKCKDKSFCQSCVFSRIEKGAVQ